MRQTGAPGPDGRAEDAGAVGDVLRDRGAGHVVASEDGIFQLDLIGLAEPVAFLGGGDGFVFVFRAFVDSIHPPWEDSAEVVLVAAHARHAELYPAADCFLGDAKQVCEVAVADHPCTGRVRGCRLLVGCVLVFQELLVFFVLCLADLASQVLLVQVCQPFLAGLHSEIGYGSHSCLPPKFWVRAGEDRPRF